MIFYLFSFKNLSNSLDSPDTPTHKRSSQNLTPQLPVAHDILLSQNVLAQITPFQSSSTNILCDCSFSKRKPPPEITKCNHRSVGTVFGDTLVYQPRGTVLTCRIAWTHYTRPNNERTAIVDFDYPVTQRERKDWEEEADEKKDHFGNVEMAQVHGFYRCFV